MAKKQPVSQLDRFLENHKPTCTFFIYSGDRHCSCGRDAAKLELEELRASLPHLCPECENEMHILSDDSFICLNTTCERYGK